MIGPGGLVDGGFFEDVPLEGGVALEVGGVGEPDDLDVDAPEVEVAGEDGAVAAVITGAAEDDDAGWGEPIAEQGGGVSAGVFHEDGGGHAELAGGAGVD